MKTLVVAFLLFTGSFPILVFSQQVGSIDLTTAPVSDQTVESKMAQAAPPGCKELLPGAIADGVISAKDREPRGIYVSVINLSNTSPKEGELLRALILLRNEGRLPIQIPWSKDPSVATAGQDVSNRFRDGGTFEFALESRRHPGRSYRLVSQTRWLYGSTSAPGTLLELKPGEWVVATTAFKAVNQYSAKDNLPVGPARMSVQWHQVLKTWTIKDCKETVGYYSYTNRLGSFYKQTSPGFRLRITPSEGSAGSATKRVGRD